MGRRFKYDRLPAEWKRQVDNQTSAPTANPKPDIPNGASAKNEAEKDFTQAVLTVHSRRHRPTDADGIFSKWAIDAIVRGGVLPDDSPAYVKEVRHTQEKIPKDQTEETIITVDWTNNGWN